MKNESRYNCTVCAASMNVGVPAYEKLVAKIFEFDVTLSWRNFETVFSKSENTEFVPVSLSVYKTCSSYHPLKFTRLDPVSIPKKCTKFYPVSTPKKCTKFYPVSTP